MKTAIKKKIKIKMRKLMKMDMLNKWVLFWIKSDGNIWTFICPSTWHGEWKPVA